MKLADLNDEDRSKICRLNTEYSCVIGALTRHDLNGDCLEHVLIDLIEDLIEDQLFLLMLIKDT